MLGCWKLDFCDFYEWINWQPNMIFFLIFCVNKLSYLYNWRVLFQLSGSLHTQRLTKLTSKASSSTVVNGTPQSLLDNLTTPTHDMKDAVNNTGHVNMKKLTNHFIIGVEYWHTQKTRNALLSSEKKLFPHRKVHVHIINYRQGNQNVHNRHNRLVTFSLWVANINLLAIHNDKLDDGTVEAKNLCTKSQLS